MSLAAGGLQMNVRELGKFGQLYLQRGKWKGEQILSEKWIEEQQRNRWNVGIIIILRLTDTDIYSGI